MNRRQSEKWILLLVALMVCCIGLLPRAVHALDVRKLRMPSGLLVLQVERHNLPVVSVNLLLTASPLNEPADKAGVAYLTAVMLTEGTTTRKATEISEDIEFLGASLGAGTTSDFTTVSLTVLKKDVEKGFELFSDVLLNPTFPEDELKRKKELVKGRLRQKEEEPSFVAEKAFIKEIFGDYPYGRLPEGSIETIDRLTREDLVAFYQARYNTPHAVLSVVGDLTPEELDRLLTRYLGAWQNVGKVPAANTDAPKPSLAKEKKSVVINRDITQANIVLGNLGISREHPDYYAVTVMNYILGGGGFASRLMKIVRDEQGLTYSIYSSFDAYKETGDFKVGVQTKNESAASVIKEILTQIEKMRTEPVSDQELSDAKSFLTGSFPRRFETSRKIADFLTAAQYYRLGDDYIEKYPEYINGVTKEDVLRVARKHLHPEKHVLIIVGNEKQMKLPDL